MILVTRMNFRQKTVTTKGECDPAACSRCGVCCICRRIDDFDLQFYKPAYQKCPYMEYVDNITRCKVYGTNKMPAQCRDGTWKQIASTCLSAYRKADNMKHLMWAKKHGHLDKVKIIVDLRQKNYEVLSFVVQTFVSPYLKHVPGTMATSYEWLDEWEVSQYLDNIPDTYMASLQKQIEATCHHIYTARNKKQQIPIHVVKLLNSPVKPISQWLKKIKHAMWG